MIPLKDRFRHAPQQAAGPSIDYYTNAEAWKPSATCTLADLIDGIRGDEYADTVAQVRALIDQGDKPAADIIKKTLPAVSLSGCITGRRKAAVNEGRFQHSGLLQIDLDAKDNPGWTVHEMREVLQADPRMVAVFITPSGQGVKGVARIPTDAANHKAAFLAAEAYFKTINLKIDASCKDPVRLCFVSHDPDAWLRMDTDEEFKPVMLQLVEDQSAPCVQIDDDHESDDDDDENERAPSAPWFSVSESGGIVIRGPQFRELDAATVADMLRCIPYPGYDKWLKITNAVWDALGEAGTPILQAWAPEKKPGDYAEKFVHRLTDVKAATLVMMAKEHGWAQTITSAAVAPKPKHDKKPSVSETLKKSTDNDGTTIPANVFPVPAGDIGHDLAARHIFTIIGPTHRLFMRGVNVHEVAQHDHDEFALVPVEPARFVSMIETFGSRVMRRELREDGIPRWRSTVFPESSAKVALKSTPSRECLPAIRQLVSAPVLVGDDAGGCMVIDKGYHPHAGGTFVTSGGLPPVMDIEDAKALLLTALEDFDFPDGGDASRALASLISPAMKIGGWIDDDFPLDIAEADQSQAGKTFRQKLVCAIYREHPSAITQAVGGVGSLDERVSTALITGRPFISFDNFRGRMDSQILETAIRGLGKVSARALRTAADIDCTPFLWQLSTNGAELTRDLANRSVITRIRKRADDYPFKKYPEGSIWNHITKHQPRFLAAVHAVVREWVRQGRQATQESRHDFKVWCRTMDWIVQNIFDFPPLLDGHREEQMRTANPKLQWLRDVIQAIITDGHGGTGITASDMAEAAEEHDLIPPGRRDSTEAMEVKIGKLLGRLFKETGSDSIVVDGRIFTRQIENEYCPINRTHRERKTYVIEDANGAKAAEPGEEMEF
jgi:hypothetical protein